MLQGDGPGSGDGRRGKSGLAICSGSERIEFIQCVVEVAVVFTRWYNSESVASHEGDEHKVCREVPSYGMGDDKGLRLVPPPRLSDHLDRALAIALGAASSAAARSDGGPRPRPPQGPGCSGARHAGDTREVRGQEFVGFDRGRSRAIAGRVRPNWERAGEREIPGSSRPRLPPSRRAPPGERPTRLRSACARFS